MKKIEIVDHVVATTELNRQQATDAVDSVFEAMRQSLARNESVFIRGFATFKAIISKATKGRNISKGTLIDIPARHSVKLIISPTLKAEMNEKLIE